jgi:hypothetical protein
MTIGFGLDPSLTEFGRPVVREISQLDVKSRFVVTDGESTNFDLAQSDVSVAVGPDSEVAKVSIKARTQKEAQEALIEAGATPDVAKNLASGIGIGISGDVPAQTVGVHARQFLPYSLAVVVNSYERELTDLLRMWGARPGEPVFGGLQTRRTTISEPVQQLLRAFIATQWNPEEIEQLGLANPITPDALSALPDLVRHAIRSTSFFTEHTADLPFNAEIEAQFMIRVLDGGVDFVRWWFETHVKHLGPLRAAPQPLYGLPEAAFGTSVGQNGEYTAAVLSTYGKRITAMPLPDGSTTRVSLKTAVDRWMDALGLLASVSPHERGKYGYELNVKIDGVTQPLDLTTVGVGVSQALPIVVLGLVSNVGSLLLFEQPELHLHPNVQAALGDFFLALARSGRQLIIETHSEYLINRLRRRQATDQDSDAADLTRLFFFERDGSSAKVDAARIGKDGSMPGWPRGFLDTAAREVEAMVLGDLE